MISDEERAELRATVRSLLERHPPARPGPGDPPAADPAVWELLAGQVGACGLAVPEEFGGAGGTLVETAVVCEELGAALAPVPYLGSAVLAVEALLACGDTEYLPGLADGSLVGAVAWAEDGSWDPSSMRTSIGPDGLTGVKDCVLDGARADVFVVVAGRCGVFAVPADAPGVAVEPLVTLDQTRPLARVAFTATRARPLSDDGARVSARLMATAAAAISAEQVGGAQRCLDTTLEYVRTRVQFGRPIGSFQAVKHRLADLFVLVTSARSASLDAVRAVASGAPDQEVRASLAKAYCSEAFRTVAAETLQLHGGIGFTWEHDAHHHFKRAHGSDHLFGSAAWHRARLAAAVL